MISVGKVAVCGVLSYFLYDAVIIIKKLNEIPEAPVLPDDAWWGSGEPRNFSDKIRDFKIQISNDVIEDLNERLDRYLKSKITPPLENSGFTYGFNTDYLVSIVNFWRHEYHWRKREAFLNRFPHFKVFINGLDIHFIHVIPQISGNKTIVPLLLLHGWPGSVIEFYDLIPLLTSDRKDMDFIFQVVAPSLPGFGFSEGSRKPGFGAAEMAVVLKNLMERLGFEKFYVQGGDWGSQLAKYMGVLFPERVLGVHGNMCFVFNFQTAFRWIFGSYIPFLSCEKEFKNKLYPLLSKALFLLQELGYMHLHASKPDSIGVALEDSPPGLAAYILEKFSTWTNSNWRTLPDGGLTRKFNLEALLDNVMIYWVTKSITASQRLYAETFNISQINLRLEEIPLRVPSACARFPHEIFWMSKPLLKRIYTNLIQVTDFDDGGHFPAFELPQLLSEDIWNAIKKFRNLKYSN